ncbi:hypothetical protein B0H13DRAFT_1888761 [Mycena leptocephala]|nr:hypothetical protein B0H13DRAFT_1888761 [Mycena leptocephala]
MHSLNDNASDEEMPDDESSDGDQASPHSLSQIDTDNAVNHCDMCQKSLGATPTPTLEWDNIRQKWGEQRNISAVFSGMAKNCGKCETELAGHAAMLPPGTVWDRGWQTSTLGEQGLIHHLGHGGDPCLWPMEQATCMTVIGAYGCQRIHLRFCGCGIFEPGERGIWEQILANGWYRAGLISPRVCAAFRVLSPAEEQSYMPE